MLCATCQQAVAGELPFSKIPGPFINQSYVHHSTYQSFLEAKKSGCRVCNMIWDGFHAGKNASVSPLAQGCEITYRWWSYHRNRKKLIGWIFHVLGPDRTGYTIQFDILEDEGKAYIRTFEPETVHDAAPEMLHETLRQIDHEIEPNTDSLSCVNLAQYWLSNCEMNHPECNLYSHNQQPLPLRVIDVGKFGDPVVRLYVPDSIPEYGRYFTLSHCWGNADFLKLTTQNESILKGGFEICKLPKTFRQAIRLTRSLSIKYLWIDSLCIMQDSPEDWRQQSAVMGEIYRRCLCNIAATQSHDSDGGIFSFRDPQEIKPLNLVIKWRRKVSDESHQGVYSIWPSELWKGLVEDSPLNERAWVMQERLLSPRILHFSKQIFWECNNLIACEILPNGNPYSMAQWDNNFNQVLKTATEYLLTANLDNEEQKVSVMLEVHRAWFNLVKKYSKCKLSKEDDILVAISAVAKMVAAAINDEYVAGLWKLTLRYDLLWSTGRHMGRTPYLHNLRRSSVYRAPSWSWASIQGPIQPSPLPNTFSKHEEILVIQIVDIHIGIIGNDKTGQVKSGSISLYGGIMELIWDPHSENGNICFQVADNALEGHVQIDDRDTWISLRTSILTNILCMPIRFVHHIEHTACQGLVLQRIGDSLDCFVRIGDFEVSCDDESAHVFKKIVEENSRAERRMITIF